MLAGPDVAKRRVIFVGDLVNRGREPRRVVELVVDLVARERALLVRGNHEQALLNLFDTGAIATFLAMGGAATIRDYVGIARGNVVEQFRAHFPKSHLDLIIRSALSFESNDLLVTHAGIDPAQPHLRTPEVVLDGDNLRLMLANPIPGMFVVCGHYRQISGKPLILDHVACLDTGAGSGGPLTAMLWPERSYIQA